MIIGNNKCRLAGICGGCDLIGYEYESQQSIKVAPMQEGLANLGYQLPVHWVSGRTLAYRSKLDFTLWVDEPAGKPIFGLYSQAHKKLIDIDQCPIVIEPLQEFLTAFRENLPPVKKGSVRLRVAPDGKWGMWLDFANIDIKNLLDTGMWLSSWYERAAIEIGQRHKRLYRNGDGQFKLKDPKCEPWFETYLGNELTPLALNTTIAGFTQPGIIGNKNLISTIGSYLGDISNQHWAEFFGGSGNLTFPLASRGAKVSMFEVDSLSLEAARTTLESLLHLEFQIDFKQQNLYAKNIGFEQLGQFDGVLVDPPRSGLKGLLNIFKKTPEQNLPIQVVYVSCYLQSLLEDLQTLTDLGYTIKSVAGVDQFTHSSHCEWVVHLVRQ